jgi:hypothetical protein
MGLRGSIFWKCRAWSFSSRKTIFLVYDQKSSTKKIICVQIISSLYLCISVEGVHEITILFICFNPGPCAFYILSKCFTTKIYPQSKIQVLVCIFFFFFGGTGVERRVLVARQAFYHLSHTSSLLLIFFFFLRQGLAMLPGLVGIHCCPGWPPTHRVLGLQLNTITPN